MSDFKSYIKNNSENNGAESNCVISESEKKQCEEKLKVLIAAMKAEIQAERRQLREAADTA